MSPRLVSTVAYKMFWPVPVGILQLDSFSTTAFKELCPGCQYRISRPSCEGCYHGSFDGAAFVLSV